MADQTKTTKYNSDTSLVLKERGLLGVDVLLFTTNVGDSEAAINKALNNPENIIAGYFLEGDKIDVMIATLEAFKRKFELYKQARIIFEGCDADEDRLSDVINADLDAQKALAPDPMTFVYNVGGDMKLFVDGVCSNLEARTEIKKNWANLNGSPALWGISDEPGEDVFFQVADRTTAHRFSKWLIQTYILPTLKRLQ